MFIDEVKLTCIAGKGGDGCVSWRREAYIPKGGPYGGNGGRGGDIIIRTSPHANTLSDYRHKKKIQWNKGIPGGTKNMHGKNAESIILTVPVGTLVRDQQTQEILWDLNKFGQQVTLCRWGRGGYGNAHFPSSIRQAPAFAERGDIGESRDIILELKLVADVALIGMPSVGKSTLIKSLTDVKPKIADYPFTTLVPNLGVMNYKNKSFVIEDVPGLIPGASDGVGLGIRFLKHIERTHFLIHMIDAFEEEKGIKHYKDIRKELELFGDTVGEKQEIIALSKIDLLPQEDRDEVFQIFLKAFPEKKIFMISCATHEGIDELSSYLIENISSQCQVNSSKIEEYQELREKEEDALMSHYKIEKIDTDVFRIHGKRIEQVVRMTVMENYEAVMRMYDIMNKIGVLEDIRQEILPFITDERYLKMPFLFFPEGKIYIGDQEFRFEKISFLLRKT